LRRLTPGGAELHPAQLDLTDEEAQRSEKSLTIASENKALAGVASHPDVTRHPREFRPDRPRVTAASQTADTGGTRCEPAPAGSNAAALGD